MRFSGFVNFLFLASFTLPAVADWTDAEIKAMPPYCEARLKRLPGQYEHWSRILGPDILHTHHFCYGLGSINRYYRARSPQEKRFHLNNANGDLTYMVSHASPTYSLMPEVYLNRGLVLSLMNDYGGAINDLRKAVELNPRLVRAYTLASDIHAKLNQKGEALKVVTEGLRHVPDSSVLQRIYKERGGKLPYPEPIARAVEEPPVPAQAQQGGEIADKDGQLQDAAQQAPATPKIGSPTNPWCRFCPEPAK